MKLAFALVMVGLLGGGATTAYSTAFSYSGALSGWTEVDLSPDGLGTGGSVVDFETISETVNYNAAAQTLQEQGSITVAPGTASFNIYSGPFSSPPGSGSVTITVGNNGVFSFDDIYPVSSSGEFGGNLAIPVSGSGIYNGQTFSASWNIDIPIVGQISAASSSSLVFGEESFEGAQQAVPVVDSLSDGTSDGTYYYSLATGLVTATNQDPAAAPDKTNSILLLGIALSSLAFFRWL